MAKEAVTIPYIDAEIAEDLDVGPDGLGPARGAETKEELAYIVCREIQSYVLNRIERRSENDGSERIKAADCIDVLGVLSEVEDEFKTRVAHPHEERARMKNGVADPFREITDRRRL